MNLHRRIAWLALPYTRCELPGWGHLLSWLHVRGPGADRIWQDPDVRRLIGKWHRYTMILDLRNWSERISYFLGRYYDLPTQLVLRALLRPGDEVMDVGANIGMITLLAADLVGPAGKVEAFEPNPACVERIAELLRENEIGHVRLHPVGLSDCNDTALLTIPGTTTGSGTLSRVTAEEPSQQFSVSVVRGDDRSELSRPIVLKVDVEGHEVRVLRGLQQTLLRCRPAVLAETIEAHLARAGLHVGDLVRLLQSLGYEGYEPHPVRSGLGYRLHLWALAAKVPAHVTDTLWLHPGSEAFARLERLIAH